MLNNSVIRTEIRLGKKPFLPIQQEIHVIFITMSLVICINFWLYAYSPMARNDQSWPKWYNIYPVWMFVFNLYCLPFTNSNKSLIIFSAATGNLRNMSPHRVSPWQDKNIENLLLSIQNRRSHYFTRNTQLLPQTQTNNFTLDKTQKFDFSKKSQPLKIYEWK